MEIPLIAELLQPFLRDSYVSNNKSCRANSSESLSQNENLSARDSFLTEPQLLSISTYLDLLLKWNSRVNLTAIRKPEAIITRHFGESLFAARNIVSPNKSSGEALQVIDLGSGAGFPGVPIKIFAPGIHLTLIEANQKKATFLRELVRTLNLKDVSVFSDRSERFSGRGDIVILRAVEHFREALPQALKLLKARGRIGLLISDAQIEVARKIAPEVVWRNPVPIPLSEKRVLLIGEANQLRT